MKKKCLLFLSMALLLVMSLSMVAFAAKARVIDEAGLLSASEKNELTKYVDEISERQNLDIVVLTVSTLDGKDIVDYADDYYDNNGYNHDGCIIVFVEEDGRCYISTSGKAIQVLTDDKIQEIGSPVRRLLNAKNYLDAFKQFASLVDTATTEYDTPAAFPAAMYGVISVIIGFIGGLIGTSSMKSKLKSVRYQSAAGSYSIDNSLNITGANDQFLYSHTDRRARPKEDRSSGSSTHTSSSGNTHGGGSI